MRASDAEPRDDVLGDAVRLYMTATWKIRLTTAQRDMFEAWRFRETTIRSYIELLTAFQRAARASILTRAANDKHKTRNHDSSPRVHTRLELLCCLLWLRA